MLANQAEDFAVQLIDQVNAKEELVIRDVPKIIDRYASMLSGMTDDAIIHSQKKVSVLSKLVSEIRRPFILFLRLKAINMKQKCHTITGILDKQSEIQIVESDHESAIVI